MDDPRELRSEVPEWFADAMRVPREEGTVAVEGCPIHYFRWGDPASPGLILLHGGRAHARCFAFVAPLLAKQFHVVAYDMSGLGDSGRREEYSHELHAREVLAVALATGMVDGGRKPFLAGHSRGAGVVATAARNHPEEVGGVISIDIPMSTPSSGRAHSGVMTSWLPGEPRPNRVYPDLETAMGRFRLIPPQPCENDFLMEYMARHSLREVEGGWTWKFDPVVAAWGDGGPRIDGVDRSETLATFPCRLAIIYGQKSPFFDPASPAHLGDSPDGRIPVVMIPDAHHHVMMEQPIALATALNGILSTWLAEDG